MTTIIAILTPEKEKNGDVANCCVDAAAHSRCGSVRKTTLADKIRKQPIVEKLRYRVSQGDDGTIVEAEYNKCLQTPASKVKHPQEQGDGDHTRGERGRGGSVGKDNEGDEIGGKIVNLGGQHDVARDRAVIRAILYIISEQFDRIFFLWMIR